MDPLALIVQSLPTLLKGALLTLQFAACSILFGLIIGIVVASLAMSKQHIWARAARIYVSIMRGTPLLVQIFVLYYGLPSLHITLEPTLAGILALSLNVGAYCLKACAVPSWVLRATNG